LITQTKNRQFENFQTLYYVAKAEINMLPNSVLPGYALAIELFYSSGVRSCEELPICNIGRHNDGQVTARKDAIW